MRSMSCLFNSSRLKAQYPNSLTYGKRAWVEKASGLKCAEQNLQLFVCARRGYESLRRVVPAIILMTVCFVAINFWDDPGHPFTGNRCSGRFPHRSVTTCTRAFVQ